MNASLAVQLAPLALAVRPKEMQRLVAALKPQDRCVATFSREVQPIAVTTLLMMASHGHIRVSGEVWRKLLLVSTDLVWNELPDRNVEFEVTSEFSAEWFNQRFTDGRLLSLRRV